MTTYYKTGFVCEGPGCHEVFECAHMPADQEGANLRAWDKAIAAGWTTDGHWYSESHYCPQCSTQREPVALPAFPEDLFSPEKIRRMMAITKPKEKVG